MPQFTIDVTEEQIQTALSRALQTTQFDEDGEPCGFAPLDIRQIVVEHVRKQAAEAISQALGEGVRAVLDEEIRKALIEGFQPMSRWGEPEGKRTTLSSVVAEALTNSSNYERKSVRDLVTEFGKEEAKRQIADMVAKQRAKIEEDLTQVAAEALRNYMRKHAGV